jgi:hypothetical protein
MEDEAKFKTVIYKKRLQARGGEKEENLRKFR